MPKPNSTSTAPLMPDPFAPGFKDIGDALLALDKLFDNDLPKEVVDLYKDAKTQVGNISTWTKVGDDGIKKKILAAYNKVDARTKDRVSDLCVRTVFALTRF
jgi:hypothetical protein